MAQRVMSFLHRLRDPCQLHLPFEKLGTMAMFILLRVRSRGRKVPGASLVQGVSPRS